MRGISDKQRKELNGAGVRRLARNTCLGKKWATAQERSSRLIARNHLRDFQARLSYQVPFPACQGLSADARMIPGCALQARCNGIQPMAVIASMALLPPQPSQGKI